MGRGRSDKTEIRRLRRVLRSTLTWFEEVEGAVYNWSEDEGAELVMDEMRNALRPRRARSTGRGT